ncbi:MAG: hypothetical protein WC635_11640 [Bacteriovorax sp.]|jgi:hypothetical protein
MKTFILLVSFIFSCNAFSTQCQFISQSAATKAEELIQKSQDNAGGVLELCQYCSEKTMSFKPIRDTAIGASGVREMPSDLWINGELVDLAYIYVKLDKARWSNLGLQLGCIVYGPHAYVTEKKSPLGGIMYVPAPR